MNETPQIIQSPSDGGPIYRETDLNAFISEPFNAISSLTFWIPVFLFLYNLRGKYHQYPFLIYFCSPLLFIGGLGSTLFHAFRSSQWLLIMDWLPILLLTVGIAVFFWHKVLKNPSYTIATTLIFVILQYSISEFASGQDKINLGYFIRGNMIFLPMIIISFQTQFFKLGWLLLSLFFFVLALFFRYIDEKYHIFDVGTHFLWHISTSVGAFFMGMFIYHISNMKFSLKN
jgi:hypothetical protein